MQLRRIFAALLSASLLACASAPKAPCVVAPPPTAPCALFECATPAALNAMSNEGLARRMINITGARDRAKQAMDMVASTLAKTPGLPPALFRRFAEKLNPETMIERLVPIYVRVFDRPTMTSAIEYYQSPGGAALIARLPGVISESMEMAKTLAREVVTETMKESAAGSNPGL